MVKDSERVKKKRGVTCSSQSLGSSYCLRKCNSQLETVSEQLVQGGLALFLVLTRKTEKTKRRY